MKTTFRVTIIALLAFATFACATTEPWQRGRLAAKEMNLDAFPAEAAYDGHILAQREAGMALAAGAGGGCGCN
jgi:hypothetical protein